MKPTTYAIVDIETTGTNPKEDRIIQFGCVLVENGKIVTRFATDVNPNRVVSKQIQSLTGLSNSRVQKAPYFEDIALTIYNLLAETTFVAHNIYFDYTFLNHELVRCGVPELTIPGIDTVELAQIFLPTETSFRLGDLAESFGLIHDNPHQADSDAQVTAELFLTIEAHMRRLPLITMEQIGKLSVLTGMNTSQYIHQITESMRKNSLPLSESLQVVDGLALQKKDVSLFSEIHYGKKEFPKKKAEKQRVFHGKLTYRKEQSRLMNMTFEHFSSENQSEKNIMVEAATGMGKTIGYLFPLSFLATPEKPAIISTVSLLLQEQILTKDIPLLNQFLEQPIQATVVKSQRHYIELQRFKATLTQPVEQKQYALYQMKVLVWLTQTKTGDFDELHMTNLNHVFWQEIRHRGISFLSEKQSFYKEDFLRHLYRRVDQSNFLIVNHAFLTQESLREAPLLPKSDYLLIDEAHHLPEIAEKISDRQFDSVKFKKRVQQITEPSQLFSQVASLLSDEESSLRLVNLYQQELEELVEEQTDFFHELYEVISLTAEKEEIVVFKEQLDDLSIEAERTIERLTLYYREILSLQDQLMMILEPKQSVWVNKERIIFAQLFSLFDSMKQQAKTVSLWLNHWEKQFVHWVVPSKNRQGGTLHIHDFDAALLPKTKWYNRYKKIMYMGGTLKIGANRSYFSKRLGIPDTSLKVIPTPYDYEEQARLYIPTQGISVTDSSSYEYTRYLSTIIRELAQQENRSILVLFTSHDSLQRVYYQLHEEFLNQGRELLAQGITGSREKLLKRFSLSSNSLLFGADSFWEGIDLPGDVLQVVVVTRLPFDNPKRPLIRARNEFLQAEGTNAFYQESVPRAALKLRQALGRLIRTETDKGVLILLDRRFLTAKYSNRLQKALPKKLPIKELPINEILTDIQQFLKKTKE
ncbi:exonuclease, DNA polymerase III, epsilon subunit [Enterococcus phoeniculicola]|jgi:ATP-dependent DNA helicase DinG|uniref:3'-5' exonuclease DinG n=1 Tax=Enterococcus phoeniculicola ATCC BAA-412 TaxID=1158610 RepID=R3WJM5_9ENTE|nr:helicase C-terminal domain-containing protein [Enterococcus phoeniculicola]EOL42085.1 exonuclease, DNA polymerase III, epsilon subunit [Enterococcus phoeniculicola ATCC BAA-412]EOT79636.1 DnaQ family exonuclease/DinG family helicase [Enterococcus phoeniculicola ATCC BAA-412]OJG71701.1 exonuclease, DNA polymerase III, epsilon subunit [Enterococcus phoeniculicola]